MKKSIFILFVCFLICGNAHADWDEWGNAAAIYLSSSDNIFVRKDGTSITTSENVVLLQCRKGIDDFGVSTYSYNKNSERVQVLSAETVNGKTTIPVDLNKLEDKPRASSLSGFDNINQIKFAFPTLHEGSIIHEKWSFESIRPKIPGFYSKFIPFGKDPEKKSQIVIESEIPLYYFHNDPRKLLSISQHNKNGRSHIEISLRKPIYRKVINESNSSLNAKSGTWIIISSEKSWEEMAKRIIPLYEERLKAPLPPHFLAIAKSAAKGNSTEEKINRAILKFSPSMRYHGDWRPVGGSHVSRPLTEIAKTGYGDCKDFAVAMTAILRSIGLTANVAWVQRDKTPPTLESPIPYHRFNHAIVHIVADGRDLWLDPTNEFRQVDVVPSDIAGRNALILNPNRPELRFVAKENPDQNQTSEDEIIKPGSDGLEKIDINKVVTGGTAYSWNASMRFEGLDLAMRVRKEVMDTQYAAEDYKMVELDKPKLNNLFSLKYRYQYRAKDSFYRTNAGDIYVLNIPAHVVDGLLSVDVLTRRSDFIIDRLRKVSTTVRFLNREVAKVPMPDCNIVSPWIDLKRTFKQTQDGFLLTEIITPKEKRIPVEDIKSSEFSSLIRDTRLCFDRVGLVFKDESM